MEHAMVCSLAKDTKYKIMLIESTGVCTASFAYHFAYYFEQLFLRWNKDINKVDKLLSTNGNKSTNAKYTKT